MVEKGLTYIAKQFNPLIDLFLIVEDHHCEGVGLYSVISTEHVRLVPSCPPHLLIVSYGGVQSETRTSSNGGYYDAIFTLYLSLSCKSYTRQTVAFSTEMEL